MKRLAIITALMLAVLPALPQHAGTDAILRLRDERKKHPEIASVSFPGNTVWRQAYDAIYSHGAIIENPWAAFRIYMNEGQAVDVYLKSTPGLECRTTGFYTTADDVAVGRGCDVLRVGKSIGAGSFRGYVAGELPLELTPVAMRTQTVENDSTVLVAVRGWMLGGKPVDVEERYTAHASSPVIDVEVRLSGHAASDLFCTGVQKLDKDNEGGVEPSGKAWSRGCNAPDSKRPDALEAVALTVCADPANVAGTAEDDLNYLILLRPDADGIIRYTIEASRP